MSARKKASRKTMAKRVALTPEEKAAIENVQLRKERQELIVKLQAQLPRDGHGRPYPFVEEAVLNAPRVGLSRSIGDLVMDAIAPGPITDSGSCPEEWEPPEGTHLRHLAMELGIIAEAAQDGRVADVDLPILLSALAKRAEVSVELAHRLRCARYGTSPTWGGVAPTRAVTS